MFGDGRRSSVAGRLEAIPDQSPDTGRSLRNSGEADNGVNVLKLLGLLGTEDNPVPGLVVTLPALDFLPMVSKSKKSGSDSPAICELSAGKGGLDAGETRGEVCIASGILSLVSKTKKASPPSPSFMA